MSSLKVAKSQSLREVVAALFETLRLCDFETLSGAIQS